MIYLTATLSPGMSLKRAAVELCQLATRLNVGVETRFNGLQLIAHPGSAEENIHRQYEFWLRYEREHPAAAAGADAGDGDGAVSALAGDGG